MFEKLQTGENIQDSLEPAAIRFTLECLQESVRRSVFFHAFISIGTLESDLQIVQCPNDLLQY